MDYCRFEPLQKLRCSPIDSTGLSYSHILGYLPDGVDIFNKEDFYRQRIVISNPISVNRWLGFKGGVWFFLKEEDPTLAAKVIGRACTHFLNVLPELTHGLELI
ncbi:hypothetical protein [Nostoc sp. CMAA1605]|uniref:hypothetical protein n=1 Tax=Nostoc sp. CMAA1605 TaxID=2055159 RepID=UPI001F3E6712|nr:hypothetical protein [Nostoc sp. CMAA1605]MCF4969546.1 hypothetical protein [Nostoc sp. CMAA1605]